MIQGCAHALRIAELSQKQNFPILLSSYVKVTLEINNSLSKFSL